MKDQELRAIDAMLTGQEKERQRLASDLRQRRRYLSAANAIRIFKQASRSTRK